MKTRIQLCSLFLVIASLVCTTGLLSQTTNVQVIDSSSIEQPRLKFGVSFGLNFVGGTNISIAPNLTYALSEKFSIGAGV